MEKQFNYDGKAFVVTCGDGVGVEMRPLSSEDGVFYYEIYFRWEKECFPDQISLEWEIPAVNAYYLWDALDKRRDFAFYNRATQSRVASGIPLKALVSKKSENACTVALSDVETPLSVFTRADCTSGNAHIGVDFFTMQTGPFSNYRAVLRIDERNVHFTQAVTSATEWLKNGIKRDFPVPECAAMPMYSTWYSYIQNVTAEKVLEECREAVKYGMKTVIVDDGWQIEKSDGAYGSCGDWQPVPSKFPDMKGFVGSLHEIGMKVMLWYAVPFIGVNAKIYPEFEGKYLYDLPDHKCSVLDPRYPEVRRYLTDTYVNAVKKWGLDGLKLDFIDRFKTNGTVLDGMDYCSVESAVTALLKQISVALHEVNPDIMIEFRQPYFGTVIGTYGNMMRVWDCPLDGATNKTQSVNLRLVSGDCAVHSDMIYWHDDESPENVACQLWGTMFSVPQISARMNSLSGGQALALSRYLSYWSENARLLLNENVRANLCENGYDRVETSDGNKRVRLLCAATDVEVGNEKTLEVVNMTDSDRLFVNNPSAEKLCVTALDCMGNATFKEETNDRLFAVPTAFCGMLCITKR